MKAAKYILKRLECLIFTVKEARRKLDTDEGEKPIYYDKLKVRLEEMQNDLIKYRSLLTGERNPIVGVFGCPSRGKSTLLNVLFGMDLLPVDKFTGTTRIGTVISYQDSESDEPFTITATYEKDNVVVSKKRSRIDVKKQLEIFSKQSKYEKPDINKIEIKGPIRSYIGNNITFIDTPGVELGASKEDLVDFPELAHDIPSDINRVLNILSTVDIVIFCMRNDNKPAKDKELYNKKLIDYEPINVITHSVIINEGQTNDQMKLNLHEKYDLMLERTVVLDSQKALNIINDTKNKNKNIVKLARKKFKGEDLEGFLELKEKILRKIRNKNYEVIDRRIKDFEDSYRELIKDAKDKEIELQEMLTDSEIKKIKKTESRNQKNVQKKPETVKIENNHISSFLSGLWKMVIKILIGVIILIIIFIVLIILIY